MMSKILLRVDRRDIALFNKIMEAYGHLGLVTTIEPRSGLVAVHHTSDTEDTVRRILDSLPFPAKILDS